MSTLLNKFPCSGCGSCCKRIGNVVELLNTLGVDEDLKFPYSYDENGVCEKLQGNNCTVYANRPLICNVDKLQEYLKIPKDIFYKENIEACNRMMDEDNTDLNLRIWK